MVAVTSIMTLINMVATACNPHDLAVSKIQDIPQFPLYVTSGHIPTGLFSLLSYLCMPPLTSNHLSKPITGSKIPLAD